jgi:hypothetical protein
MYTCIYVVCSCWSETADHEKRLTSPKNVVFLYLDAKLHAENTTLPKVIPKFDKGKKGTGTSIHSRPLVLGFDCHMD